jgi:hypothetical protein
MPQGVHRLKSRHDPQMDHDVANKKFVEDSIIAAGGFGSDAPRTGDVYGRIDGRWAEAVPLDGGTMTGELILPGPPTQNDSAATKGYVDATTGGGSFLPLAGGTLTGALLLPPNAPVLDEEAANKAYVDFAAGTGNFLPLAGGSLTGALLLHANPTLDEQAATKNYVDNSSFVPIGGGTMTGFLNLFDDPTANAHAATKRYVDTIIASIVAFQGTWQVAANIPNLDPALLNPSGGDYWVAETANPLVPEIAPPEAVGIAGRTIQNGDLIFWSGADTSYHHLGGAGGGLTRPEANATYVRLDGSTMTGALLLNEEPQDDSQAATKKYVDDNVLPDANADGVTYGRNNNAWEPVVSLDGDEMTGHLTLSDAPINALHAATKLYVDDTVADAIAAIPPIDLTPYLELAGGTMTGFLTLSADPIDDMHAVTKLYVDTEIAAIPPPILGGPFLELAGGTLVGDLIISNPAGGSAEINITGSEGGVNRIRFRSPPAGQQGDPPLGQWMLEGGAANFLFRRYLNGVFQDVPLLLDYTNGSVSLRAPRTETGDPVNADDLVRKAYADGFVRKGGDTMTGALRMQNAGIAINSNLDSILNMDAEESALIITRNAASAINWTFGSWFSANFLPAIKDSFVIGKAAAAPIFTAGLEIKWADLSIHGGRFHTTAGDPVGNNELTRKIYVDTAIAGVTVPPPRAVNVPTDNPITEANVQLALQGLETRKATVVDVNLRVLRAGDTMGGVLNMGLNKLTNLGAPTLSSDAVTKQYVDTLAASFIQYQGTWQVATNNPNLITWPAEAGHYFVARTVNPDIPETAAAGIPGIGGKSIRNGDNIIWSASRNIWEDLAGGGMSRPEADALYLAKAGGTMTGAIILAADPTAALHPVTRRYLETQIESRLIQVWRAGADYKTDQPVLYDNRTFRVLVDMLNVAAIPDFTKIKPIGWGQSDYWSGTVLEANWAAPNWVHIASFPAYGTYRVEISSFHVGQDSTYLIDIVMGYATATATLVGQTRQFTGTFSEIRLSQASNGGDGRLEMKIAAAFSATALKIFIQGEANRLTVNSVAIQKPPFARGGGTSLGGTQRAIIHNVGGAAFASSGEVDLDGRLKFYHAIPTDINDGTIGVRQHTRGINIVGAATEAIDATRYVSLYGMLDAVQAVPGVGTGNKDAFSTALDNHGLTLNGGGRFYKASGTGIIIRQAGATQPQIENNDGTNRRQILDSSTNFTISGTHTYTGTHTHSAGINFGSVNVTDARDTSRHIAIYGSGVTSFGLSAIANNFNIVASGGAGNRISFYAGTATTPTVDISNAGIHLRNDGGYYDTFNGGRFYKATGTGIVLRMATGNVQPQIENNDGTSRRSVMDNTSAFAISGVHTYSAGIGFGSSVVTDARDLSRHIALWGATTVGFGFNVTSGFLNIVAAAAVTNRVGFMTGTGTARSFEVHSGGILLPIDGQYLETFGGGRFYKAVGTGLIVRQSSGNTGLQIENNDGTNRRAILDTTNGDARYLRAASLDRISTAIAINLSSRYARIRSQGSDAGIGNNPPTLRANSNSIYVSNANWTSPLYLPAANYLGQGEPFFFESDSTFVTVISNTRTSMTSNLNLTTGNTAVFIRNATLNLWEYVGTVPNGMIPASNKFNSLNVSYTLPLERGAANTILTSNGSGGTTWALPSRVGPLTFNPAALNLPNNTTGWQSYTFQTYNTGRTGTSRLMVTLFVHFTTIISGVYRVAFRASNNSSEREKHLVIDFSQPGSYGTGIYSGYSVVLPLDVTGESPVINVHINRIAGPNATLTIAGGASNTGSVATISDLGSF